MQYIFQVGRLFDCSLAEFISLINTNQEKFFFSVERIHKIASQVKKISEDFIFYEGEMSLEEANSIFERAGGLIRVCEVIEDQEGFLDKIDKSVDFGVSFFGYEYNKGFINSIKKTLKDKGISVRYIIPEEDTVLNSAQVRKNKLIEKGFELCLIKNINGEPIIAKTINIQDIDEFSKRDYERPYTDKQMGVLPPKLARIMINIANVEQGSTIWDPFCGSGTILSEALILGYNAIGTDKDDNAVFFSEKNIEWLSKNYNLKSQQYAIRRLDITDANYKIIKELKNTQIDAIVCEPYMGPPQKRIIDMKKVEKLCGLVTEQYRSLVEVIKSIGNRKLRLVLVVPAYKTYQGWVSPRLTEVIPKGWERIDKYLAKDLQWKRSNSIIMRKLFVYDVR